MLFDILGIALAFATIMLLFSMMVTALVQAIQATFNLRFYNLKTGLLLVGDAVEEIPSTFKGELDKILSFGKFEPKTVIHQFFRIKKTEITEDDFLVNVEPLLKSKGSIINDKVRAAFKDAEKYMVKRYQRIMHILSIVLALFIAFVFQINSFDILRDLSLDPALREKYINMANEFNPSVRTDTRGIGFREVAKESLEQLIEDHKDLTINIEEISSKSDTADDAIHELELVVDDEKIIKDYQALIEKHLMEKDKKARQNLEQIVSITSAYDFAIWPNGNKYYWGSISALNNLIGTFISGVLISLGAPFWFNAIKNLSSLRDRTSSR